MSEVMHYNIKVAFMPTDHQVLLSLFKTSDMHYF